MAADPHLAGAQTDEPDVMAALDGADGAERLVIADVSRDEAWLSTPAGCAADLPEWR
jgi:hypothetical protein